MNRNSFIGMEVEKKDEKRTTYLSLRNRLEFFKIGRGWYGGVCVVGDSQCAGQAPGTEALLPATKSENGK